MGNHSALGTLPWVTAAAVLGIGIAARDCVLIAMGPVFGLYAFNAGMELGAPWQGWRAAIRCWLVGTLGLIAAVALMVMVVGALVGWWTPANDQPARSLSVLLIATAACWIAHGRMLGSGQMQSLFLALVAAAALAIAAKAHDLRLAPCVFAVLVSIFTAVLAWRLARHAGRELAISDQSAM